MNVSTIIVCILIVAAVIFAFVSIIRDRRRGRCSCGCDACPGSGACTIRESSTEDDTGL